MSESGRLVLARDSVLGGRLILAPLPGRENVFAAKQIHVGSLRETLAIHLSPTNIHKL